MKIWSCPYCHTPNYEVDVRFRSWLANKFPVACVLICHVALPVCELDIVTGQFPRHLSESETPNRQMSLPE